MGQPDTVFAMVTMEQEADAGKCIAALNLSLFQGNRIEVKRVSILRLSPYIVGHTKYIRKLKVVLKKIFILQIGVVTGDRSQK